MRFGRSFVHHLPNLGDTDYKGDVGGLSLSPPLPPFPPPPSGSLEANNTCPD